MDITTNDETGKAWDFDDAGQRSKARERLRRDKPMVLIGSPMCTAFCRLQSINYAKMDPDRVRAILARARMHLNFVCSLYEEQVKSGRYFIHEHPAMATLWEEPAVRRVMKMANVQVSRVDACQYGMTGSYHGEELPIKKPTRWMTNMRGVTEILQRTCSGRDGLCADGRQHATCTGKRADMAAIYPLKLCKAILQGITNHLTKVGLLHQGCMGIMPDAEDEAETSYPEVSDRESEEVTMARIQSAETSPE